MFLTNTTHKKSNEISHYLRVNTRLSLSKTPGMKNEEVREGGGDERRCARGKSAVVALLACYLLAEHNAQEEPRQ